MEGMVNSADTHLNRRCAIEVVCNGNGGLRAAESGGVHTAMLVLGRQLEMTTPSRQLCIIEAFIMQLLDG
jgi:hypothetical protein